MRCTFPTNEVHFCAQPLALFQQRHVPLQNGCTCWKSAIWWAQKCFCLRPPLTVTSNECWSPTDTTTVLFSTHNGFIINLKHPAKTPLKAVQNSACRLRSEHVRVLHTRTVSGAWLVLLSWPACTAKAHEKREACMGEMGAQCHLLLQSNACKQLMTIYQIPNNKLLSNKYKY